jgi:hypothetical protein
MAQIERHSAMTDKVASPRNEPANLKCPIPPLAGFNDYVGTISRLFSPDKYVFDYFGEFYLEKL